MVEALPSVGAKTHAESQKLATGMVAVAWLSETRSSARLSPDDGSLADEEMAPSEDSVTENHR